MKAYLVDGIRTPIGSFGGTLASVRTDDLAALTISELLKRNQSLDPASSRIIVTSKWQSTSALLIFCVARRK